MAATDSRICSLYTHTRVSTKHLRRKNVFDAILSATIQILALNIQLHYALLISLHVARREK